MRTTMKRLPGCLSIVLASLAVGALAACSGSAGPPASPPQPGISAAGNSAAAGTGASTGTPTASSTYCARVPSSLIKSALGLSVGKQDPLIEGPVAVCSYSGRYEVLVRYQVNENAAQFGQDEMSMASHHQTVASVSDLGDGAFSATMRAGESASNTLAARKGVVAIFITAPASLTSERTLMKILLNQL